MIKRLCLSLALAAVATLLIMVPVLAAHYAYIYVEESAGNSYDELPVMASTNITLLAQSKFITSTGLDTRVLTGSGDALPHMLADDKLLFVTDLEAYEDKTLIFYLGATSLSSFPIIVGYNGSFETPDDPDLELGYVMELLVDGYFDASAGSDKNILYKEDAFRIWISAANTLKVAAYNSTGDEQWEMHYSSFTTGEHTVYVVCNGLGASLYVDDFVTAKDTQNLFTADTSTLINVQYSTLNAQRRSMIYWGDMYWAFYGKQDGNLYWETSSDAMSWSSEYSEAGVGGDTVAMIDLCERDDYVHIAYAGASETIRYRKGLLVSNSTITWSDGWQTPVGSQSPWAVKTVSIGANGDSYPFVAWQRYQATGAENWATYVTKSSTNNGTWATDGGYPLELWAVYVPGVTYWASSIVSYYSGNKMYVLWKALNSLYGRYYNGTSWSGSDDVIDTDVNVGSCNGVSDDEDNTYLTWFDLTGWGGYFKVRYADATWSNEITIDVDAGHDISPASVTYNPSLGYIYLTYFKGDYFRCLVLSPEGTLISYPIFPLDANGYYTQVTANAYGDHIGFTYIKTNVGSATYAGYVDFPYPWTDNSNDWYWMQNNVMPYADDIQMAIDGTLELEYKPADIIEGTTLPDEENDHDGTITWGTNPTGVNATVSDLQTDTTFNQTYYYQYMNSDTQDIIQPEPETMIGDVDLERLHDNPLYPLVAVLAAPGLLTERLVWLLLAWFLLIAAMLGVHLGFDTRPDTEKPQHFILTTIAGLGLSILFYTMGIFPLWVVILMAFGLVGAIIWERQPVL